MEYISLVLLTQQDNQRLGTLNRRHFLTVPDQGANRVSVWRELSFWLAHICLLAVSSGGLCTHGKSEGALVSLFL